MLTRSFEQCCCISTANITAFKTVKPKALPESPKIKADHKFSNNWKSSTHVHNSHSRLTLIVSLSVFNPALLGL